MEANKRIRLKVASPCNADWNSMTGDEAMRFCGSCNKNVYQLSNMSIEQVEALLAESGEAKCGRFYQRKDGTLMTSDCAVGAKRVRRKQVVLGAGMGVLSAIGVSIGSMGSSSSSAVYAPSEAAPLADEQAVPQVHSAAWEDAIELEPDIEEVQHVMGEVSYQPEVKMGKIAIEDFDELEDAAE